MYWRISTTTTKSQAHTNTRVADSVANAKKKNSNTKLTPKTQTGRVLHAQRKQEKHISKRLLLKHFRPTLLTAGREIASSDRITVGRCLHEETNFRNTNTEHN